MSNKKHNDEVFLKEEKALKAKKDNEDFMKDIKKTLTRILFLQNVAGARNVSYLTRLEALHEDVACVVAGKEPTSSQRVVENTRLPDRC